MVVGSLIRWPSRVCGLLGCISILLSCLSTQASEGERVDFNRDVRPILSDKCFHCHGPDAENQDSDFRLDSRDAALEDLGGYAGVVPGDLKASELHLRIHETDLDSRMPPPDSNRTLSDQERETLDQWIEQGAEYDKHWSFKPIVRPSLPVVENRDWPANEIDYFVLAGLEAASLQPSQAAEKARLIRRVTLDLTGLPPELVDVQNFLDDPAGDAWEKVVDRLLESKAYGEQMALIWLDAARYADSGGYQNDIARTQWPWRDWVIDAYNRNVPFDQFTIEQLAGDLLANPTEQQLLATAFNRNHRINNEGGIIPEEFRVEYVADRVETTSTVWLGLTVGCARCHDHKYDPISQKDFYRMFAFFNRVPENGRDGTVAPVPNMAIYSGGTKAQHDQLKQAVANVQQQLDAHVAEQESVFEAWLASATSTDHQSPLALLRPATTHLTLDAMNGRRLIDARNSEHRPVFVGKKKEMPQTETANGGGLRIGASSYLKLPDAHRGGFDANKPSSWMLRFQPPKRFAGSEGPLLSLFEQGGQRGYRLLLQSVGEGTPLRVGLEITQDADQKNSLDIVSDAVIEPGKPICLGVTYDGRGAKGVKFFIDGKPVESKVIKDELQWTGLATAPLLVGARNVADAKSENRDATLLKGILDDIQIYDHDLSGGEIAELSTASPVDVLLASYTDAARPAARTYFLNHLDSKHLELRSAFAKVETDLERFEEDALTLVSIMEDMPEHRETYLLQRGVYDNPDTTEELAPLTLATLPPMSEELPRNRLGLAKWLVDPSNPLTARVAVNRYWQQYFGRGLVATQEDFGSQGASPSHPKLLDWLAADFIQSGWDIKAMQKKIVMSAAYRQSSRVTPSQWEQDPKNERISRGPRFRLSGQALRDQALSVAGLLSGSVGGPPVMPYQPAGLWDEVNAKGYQYVEGEGDDLYRRSLYTFWRRTVPPPSMMNFDTSAREMCSVRFSRTNTPLQALNLMNDPQFVEAARCFAERMMNHVGKTPESRIRYGYVALLTSDPTPATLEVLTRGYQRYRRRFSQDIAGARELISTGASEPDKNLDVSELAAMTMVANVLLNLDETVTKE